MLEPVLELGELVDPVLDSVLAPVPLVALLEVPPDCAHDAPATATNAAATAAAIALTITFESPWSVEVDCARGVAKAVPVTERTTQKLCAYCLP